MINFFRKIRKQMADDNKPMKYMRYAIGEIILVVIGILIALQINNYNIEQKNEIKEHMLLAEMVVNLKDDLKDINWKIDYTKKKILSNNAVLSHLTSDSSMTDSLSFHYSNIYGYYGFDSNTSAYENIKSVGFDLIKVDSLRRQITELYEIDYSQLKQTMEVWDQRHQNDKILPQVTANILHYKIWSSAQPQNIENLRTNNQFIEIIKFNIVAKELIVYYLGNVKRNVIELKSGIEHYLEIESR